MRMNIISLFLSVAILFGTFSTVSVSAQTNVGPDTGNSRTVLDDSGASTRQDPSTVETGIGGGPGDVSSSRGRDVGLNWLWLLPILAVIPLYYAWRSNDDTTRIRRYGE